LPPPRHTLYYSSILHQPPTPTLFPYTTLFRSHQAAELTARAHRLHDEEVHGGVAGEDQHREDTVARGEAADGEEGRGKAGGQLGDRKSTRLNSSHRTISYAVFCLKKKKEKHSY